MYQTGKYKDKDVLRPWQMICYTLLVSPKDIFVTVTESIIDSDYFGCSKLKIGPTLSVVRDKTKEDDRYVINLYHFLQYSATLQCPTFICVILVCTFFYLF